MKINNQPIKKIVLTEKFEKSKRIATKNIKINELWVVPNSVYWINEFGEFHRENDKPAIISNNGTKHWYQNGQRHRAEGKPAIVGIQNNFEWWENGILIKVINNIKETQK